MKQEEFKKKKKDRIALQETSKEENFPTTGTVPES